MASNKIKSLRLAVAACFVSLTLPWACTYNPPPDIQVSKPERGGAMAPGDRIRLAFTEPVKAETVVISLWYNSGQLFDVEGERLPPCEQGTESECVFPLFGPCSVGGNCDGASVSMTEDARILVVEPEGDLAIGNYLLRIDPGVKDKSGNATGVFLDLFFTVSPSGEAAPTSFASGTFITWLDLSEPLAYPLEVYWIMDVDSETGLVTGGGCDADAIDPKTTKHDNREAENWFPWPYTYDEGYHIAFSGQAKDIETADDAEESYFFQSDPFNLYVGPPVEVEVANGTIQMTVTYDESLGREVANGYITSPETYILGSSQSGKPGQEASGTLYGYRLSEEEIQVILDEYPVEWEKCASPDDPGRAP